MKDLRFKRTAFPGCPEPYFQLPNSIVVAEQKRPSAGGAHATAPRKSQTFRGELPVRLVLGIPLVKNGVVVTSEKQTLRKAGTR